MPSRQSVKVTYAHKRRRIQTSKTLPSSPLEALPPNTGDLTHDQMARRMLKRSRRVALVEQPEDANVEQIREHLAKRLKHTQERVSNIGPSSLNDSTFQTPFSSPKHSAEPVITKQIAPDLFSPVPIAKRPVARTSSSNLKENNIYHPRTLASPFNSHPGSAISSPNRKDRGRSARRGSRSSLYVKSRTLSAAFKENGRRSSRKNSAVSPKITVKERSKKYPRHQRYPSSQSTSYMRPHFAQGDWITSPSTFSRTFDDHDQVLSPSGSVHSDVSFYIGRPQHCSTPAMSRYLRRRQTRSDNIFSSPPRKDSTEANILDIEMTNATVPTRPQTIHLSRNSIFSSSDEFTIGSLPAVKTGQKSTQGTIIGGDEPSTWVIHQPAVPRELTDKAQAGQTLTGSFVAEYDVPLPDPVYSPAFSVRNKMLGPNAKVFIGEQLFGLPGTSPDSNENMQMCRNPGAQTPPASPARTTISCPPSSPASDLAQEFVSMNIRDGLDTHLYGEVCPSSVKPQATGLHRPLQDAPPLTESTTKKSTKRVSTRNRASTIRAVDFAKPSTSCLSTVRRTRSGTVVGPDSTLATKEAGLPGRSAKVATATTVLAPIPFGSEQTESDDELLLKSAWVEDLEYLGLAVPRNTENVEADEMNLGGLWHGLTSGPPRRLGLRRR